MNISVVGTNHNYSPLWFREKLVYSRKILPQALAQLKEKNIFKGAVILSTCNRIEFYLSADNLSSARQEIINFLCCHRQLREKEILSYFYFYEGKEAFRHLARVAAGLDSLILGEAQIGEQVKAALDNASSLKFVDAELFSLFSFSLRLAQKVQAQTKIAQSGVSIGAIAVQFIKEKLKSLRGKKILLIGMGKVTKLVLEHLKHEEVSVLFLANRTYAKAKIFAGQIGGCAVRFAELENQLHQADVVITATRSSGFIIYKETLKNLSRPILIIDLALPRDVDPEVGNLDKVEFFSLEDLKTTIKKNNALQEPEARKAEASINAEIERSCKENIAWEPELAALL